MKELGGKESQGEKVEVILRQVVRRGDHYLGRRKVMEMEVQGRGKA